MRSDEGPDLSDIADRYVNGGLGEGDAEAFEARVREDPRAREAYILAVTLRAAVDLATSGACEGRVCASIRGFLPDYEDGSLPPSETRALSEHLQQCDACDVYYRERLSRSTRGRRYVAGAVVVIAALVSWVAILSLREGPGHPSPTEASMELPLQDGDLVEVLNLVRDGIELGEHVLLERAVELVEGKRPDFFPAARTHGDVADAVDAMVGEGEPRGRVREALLLYSYMLSVRLTREQRRDAVAYLWARLSDAKPLVSAIAKHAPSSIAAYDVLRCMRSSDLDASDGDLLRLLFDHGVRSQDGKSVGLALRLLSRIDQDAAHRSCLSILRGDFGEFGTGPFPSVERVVNRTRRSDPDRVVRDLEPIASSGKVAIGRAVALRMLWKYTGDPDCEQVLLDLTRNQDHRARAQVARHLLRYGTGKHLSVLRDLASDERRSVRKRAIKRLQELASSAK